MRRESQSVRVAATPEHRHAITARMDLFAPDNSDLLGGPTIEFQPLKPRQPRGELVNPHVLPDARPPARVIVLPPDPTQAAEKAKKLITQNKIRQAFHVLALNNLDAVQSWLHEVAKDSPAKAVELFVEIAKFALPQLKEATLTVNKGEQQQRTYTSSADILNELNQGAE